MKSVHPFKDNLKSPWKLNKIWFICSSCTVKSNRAYQKTMAIRNYLAILLRSAIPKCIKKTMAIDRIETCIFYDRGRIATIEAGTLGVF